MPVTLDIGTSRLKLLWVQGNRVKQWSSTPLAAGGVRDGHILQPQVIGAAIDSLFKSLKISRANVIVTLTGLSFTYRMLSLPRMKPSQLEEAINRVAKKEIPLPSGEFYVSWRIINTGKEEIEIFLAGVPRNLIDDLIQALNIAGIKPSAIDLKALALSRAAGKEEALVVDFDSDCFDIVVVAKGTPTILHSVIPKSEAATLEDNVQRLVDEVTRTVDFYNITHGDNPIPADIPMVLAGDLMTSESTVDLVRSNIGYPVELITSRLKHPADFPVPAYAANIGLAIRGEKRNPARDAGRFNDINIDLLAGKRRYEVVRVPLSHRILPLALIIVVACLFLLAMLNNQARLETNRLNGEVGRLERELNLVRMRADEGVATEEKIKQLQSEAENITQQQQIIFGKGINDADVLEFVTGILPTQADYTTLEISPEEITVDGEADTTATILEYATDLESGGFSDVRVGMIDEITGRDGSNRLSFTIVISR
jgi:Tfp pilus assembly PilM family ATPase